MDMNNHAKLSSPALGAILYMALAMIIWAAIETIALLFSQHYSSFQVVWMRYSVHLLFMLIVLGPRARARLFRTQRLGMQFLRGMLMMGMHLSFIFAVRHMPVSATMAGFWVTPLLLLGFSALRGERPDWLHWLITAALSAGVWVILRPVSAVMQPAGLLAISMALCFVIYMQMTRAMKGEDLLASLFYTAFSVWIVLSAFMPFYWVTPTFPDLLVAAAIGLLGYVGILGFDRAAELAPTWVSAPIGFLQPVMMLFSDWIFRHHFAGRLSLGVAGLIVSALGFLAWRSLPALRSKLGYHHV